MLDLYRAGILRRRVYDYLPLQRALAANGSNTRVDEALLEGLLAAGAGPRARRARRRGAQGRRRVAQRDALRERRHRLARRHAHRGGPGERAARARRWRANAWALELQGGTVMHAGFLLGPRAFYAALCALPESERRLFDMRGVGYINQLYGDDLQLRVAQRSHARFVNTTMMLTTLGAAVSDGLADGRVVSGVGGQYNFVAMAHALPGARSVLCVRSTRRKDGKLTSNIVTSYGHTTIPRHLRDIAITEYGIADLRGRTDARMRRRDAQHRRLALPGRAAARRRSAPTRSMRVIAFRTSTGTTRRERLEAGLRRAARARDCSPSIPSAPISRARKSIWRARCAGSRTTPAGLRPRLRHDRARVARRGRAPTDRGYLARLQLGAPANFSERLTAKLVGLALRATRAPRAPATSQTAAQDP